MAAYSLVIFIGRFDATSWQWWQTESWFLKKGNQYLSLEGIYQLKVFKIDMVQ